MTGRERTLKALNGEPVDRPPVAGGLLQNPGLLAKIAGEDDFWESPRKILFEAFRRLGCDAILGPVMPKRPDEVTLDADGNPTDFSRHDAETILTTPEQTANYAKSVPPPEEVRRTFDHQGAYDEYVSRAMDGQEECPDMLLIPHCLGYAPAFPTSNGHFSYESFLMACALYTDDMRNLFDNWGETSRARFEAVARAIVDHNLPRLLWIGQDLCDTRSPVLSPQLLDKLYFPQLARAVEPLKKIGVRLVWHTDANYRMIIDRLLQLGIDGFQGFYETDDGIRLHELAKKTNLDGDPVILFGSVATAWVLPNGTVDDVRADVRRCLAVAENRGRLLLAPSSSIGPEVPEENVLAMYEVGLHQERG